MNFKKVMLVTLMLLAILTIGAVSASEDIASDNLTVETEDIDDVVAIDEFDTNEEEQMAYEDDAVAEEKLSSEPDFQPIRAPLLYVPGPDGMSLFKGLDTNRMGISVYNCTVNYTLIIDGDVKFNGTVGEPGHSFNINTLPLGNHTWNMSYSYLFNGSVTANECNGYFTLTYYSIVFPEKFSDSSMASMRISKDANGRAILSVNGVALFNVSLENFTDASYYKYYLFSLDKSAIDKYGLCNYTIEYIGENYQSFSKNGTFEHTSPFNVYFNKDGAVRYGDDLRASAALPEDASNNITFSVNGKTYSWNSSKILVLSRFLDLGKNVVSFTYEDEKYPKKVLNYTIETYAKFILADLGGVEVTPFIKYGDNLKISLALPENATGHVFIYKLFNESGVCSNKTIAQYSLNDGAFSYTFDSSVIGIQKYFFEYVGDDYTAENATVDLRVAPKILLDHNEVPKSVSVSLGDNSGWLEVFLMKWYANPEDASEDDWSAPSPLYNGTVTGDAIIPLGYINAADAYEMYFIFTSGEYQDYDYLSFSVAGTPKITPKATSLVCGFESYSVTVLNRYGCPAVSKEVVFKVNGKKIATALTDSKGVAKVRLNYAPKTYAVTAEALGVSLTKKVTIKHALVLKTVTVKRSAKKLVLTATLKNGKKPVSGKTVTFKFNGKTYRKTTNKKGIAKVTIKKSVLKKLKVGKKVKYQATYLKDTVKKSVKVKK